VGDALRLLLVEDEPFIALDLEMLAGAAGHEVVGVADTFDSAVELAAANRPDAALVDINLRDGFSGVQVSRALSGGQGVAVGFVTGNAEQVPPDFAGARAVLEKPFTPAGVEELLSILEAAVEGEGAPSPPRHARLAPSP
jgi:DNA-binding response OmpR family regulator